MANNRLLSTLPKVDTLLDNERISTLNDVPRCLIIEAIRETLDLYRKSILDGLIQEVNIDSILSDILKSIDIKNSMHLKKVINATGTVLHTNLGRAVLSSSAIKAIVEVSEGYNNLEFNLEEGIRGSRYSHVEKLLCTITGAEAAMVVNNNAAAVMLVLSTLCKDKEAVVSRGQLVEIGGSFRIPAVMEQSGAKLIEVGTTNRTHLYDYENAISENTGVMLRVHQSNYKILGFTEDVDIKDLVALGKKNNIPVVEDIGSGLFIDMSKYGLSHEPTVQESIASEIDVVTFSGDKILGGPQAGIIVGKKSYIDLMKKNQLTRALRIDKLTLAALEATLRIYLDENKAIQDIPGLNMLTENKEQLKKDAIKLSKMIKLRLKKRATIEILSDYSQVGGGAMPLESLETYVVAVKPNNMKIDRLEYLLRTSNTPVISRINKDKLIFDVRTLFSGDYRVISELLDKLIQE